MDKQRARVTLVTQMNRLQPGIPFEVFSLIYNLRNILVMRQVNTELEKKRLLNRITLIRFFETD